jgi:hypothetical protein
MCRVVWLVFLAVLRQGQNPFFTCEDVVPLAWSITQAADAVFFGNVVVALPADFMVKTVGGQARSCVSHNSVYLITHSHLSFQGDSFRTWKWRKMVKISFPFMSSTLCCTLVAETITNDSGNVCCKRLTAHKCAFSAMFDTTSLALIRVFYVLLQN